MAFSINIRRHFDSFDLSIEYSFEQTKITGIFGSSGAGKSTLLKALAGLDTSVSGSIVFNNDNWLDSNEKKFIPAEHRPMSLVFQDARLFPHLSVYENLAFAFKRRKTDEKFSLDEMLSDAGLIDKKNAKIASLSGGEQQRVALLRALALAPKLLLLDEPFNALDKVSKSQIFSLLKRYQAKFHTTILFVSHQIDDIYQLSEQLIVIEAGKVIDSGDTKAVTLRLNKTKLIEPHAHLSLVIKELNNGHGLAELKLEHETNVSQSLFMTSEKVSQKTTTLNASLYAKDVSISLSDAATTSMVNCLPVKIVDIEEQGMTVLLTLALGEVQLFSNITSYSFEKMNLSLNQQVFVQFKASALDII